MLRNLFLLKRICLQILSDEEEHIRFQCDLLKMFHTPAIMVDQFINQELSTFPDDWYRIGCLVVSQAGIKDRAAIILVNTFLKHY